MGNIIDYTKMRLGAKLTPSTKIVKCPKCGRKGLMIPFSNDTIVYDHKKRYLGGIFYESIDSCTVNKKEEL